MDECQQAFKDLKAYLALIPLLSPSKPGEKLYLYLVLSYHAVSSALIREERKVQKPIYYTSKALRGAEERYPPMEKLAFSLVTATRKFSCSYNQRLNRSSIEEGHEQAGGRWMTNLVGSRT